MAWWPWALAGGIWQSQRRARHARHPKPVASAGPAITHDPTLPAPIADRVGHVGGIESVTVDGRRWYFGFDFRSDAVVSPLIDDADTMARFASRYMAQTDGRHAAPYWRDLVDASVNDSELSSTSGSRDFSEEALSGIAADLHAAMGANRPVPGFAIEYHLIYLLGVASDWAGTESNAEVAAAWQRLGIRNEMSGLDAVIEMIDGRKAPPNGASCADAARVLQAQLDASLSDAVANWGEVFASLRSS